MKFKVFLKIMGINLVKFIEKLHRKINLNF